MGACAEESACQRHSLPLPGAQFRAIGKPFSQRLSYPCGKSRMISSAPATRAAARCQPYQRLLSEVTQGNAFGDRRVESNRFLEKNGHLSA